MQMVGTAKKAVKVQYRLQIYLFSIWSRRQRPYVAEWILPSQSENVNKSLLHDFHIF